MLELVYSWRLSCWSGVGVVIGVVGRCRCRLVVGLV